MKHFTCPVCKGHHYEEDDDAPEPVGRCTGTRADGSDCTFRFRLGLSPAPAFLRAPGEAPAPAQEQSKPSKKAKAKKAKK